MSKDKWQEKIQNIEEGFIPYLPKEEGYEKTVLEAVNYSINAGGKRLRPMFLCETYSMFGGTDEKAVRPFMMAIEMIHTYSLVHDDLPAMDNDDYRRGKLTTHKKYGEAMGILAGDALLNLAYETAFLAFDSKTDKQRIANALKVLGTGKKQGFAAWLADKLLMLKITENLSMNRCFIMFIKIKLLHSLRQVL